MRRWLSFSVIVISASLAAVPAGAAQKRIGFVAGGHLSKQPALAGSTVFHEDVIQQSSSRAPGALAGGIFEWDFGDVGALRLEPKYMRLGTEIDVTLRRGNTPSSGTLVLDYVSLPIMYRSSLFKKKPVQVSIVSGLGADFLVSGKFRGQDVKDEFKSFGVSIQSRLGIQGKVGRGLLGVHASIVGNLTRIDKKQTNQGKLKNSGLGLAVEYTVSLKK